jgi:hypothetical protein
VVQPSGYDIENPCSVDVKRSLNGGAADVEAVVLGLGSAVAAGVAVVVAGGGVGVTSGPAEQPTTMTTTANTAATEGTSLVRSIVGPSFTLT